MRTPMIVMLIAVVVVVALPIYLYRRPKPITPLEADAGLRADVSDAGTDAGVTQVAAQTDAGAPKRMTLGDPKVIKCVPKGGGRVTNERCDHMPVLEDALARSIRDNVACAPPSAVPYTVSFVLTADFDRKKLHVWAGRSGSLKKRNASDLIRCVEHAIAQPDWNTVAHQYAKYEINVLASYPASGAAGTTPLGGP
jgi:hypothetical protein